MWVDFALGLQLFGFLFEFDRDFQGFVVAEDGERDAVAGAVAVQGVEEVEGVADFAVIDLLDDVAHVE